MTIGEQLFDPELFAESMNREDALALVEEHKQIFRNALGNTSGKKLLELLATVCPPYGPSFTGDFDPLKAAHKDGERSLIALMALNATSEGI